jgi:hypothetical protein
MPDDKHGVLLVYAKPQAEHTLNSSGVPRHFSSLTSTMFNFCAPSSTVGYATMNSLLIKSGCYNECGGILSVDVAHVCA